MWSLAVIILHLRERNVSPLTKRQSACHPISPCLFEDPFPSLPFSLHWIFTLSLPLSFPPHTHFSTISKSKTKQLILVFSFTHCLASPQIATHFCPFSFPTNLLHHSWKASKFRGYFGPLTLPASSTWTVDASLRVLLPLILRCYYCRFFLG